MTKWVVRRNYDCDAHRGSIKVRANEPYNNHDPVVLEIHVKVQKPLQCQSTKEKKIKLT